MTTMPTWRLIMERAHVSRATVHRYLQRLIEWGLLAVVATGRKGGDEGGMISPNDAAIYVLCEPRSPEPEQNEERSETPILLTEEGEYPPTYACEARKKPRTPVKASDPQYFPGNSTINGTTKAETKAQKLLAAKELQRRSFPLRQVSPKHLAWVCAPFLRAGWTVSDILKAIDQRPGQGAWAHDGAHGIVNVAPWLQHRLSAWISDGTPLASWSQRERHQSEALHAQAAETHRRLVRERATAHERSETASRGAAAVREALRLVRMQAATTRP